ncbi:MAG: hypothetical protein AUJ75_01665 [Candidatus Omnitrophica bacterium CG1_02_49_10]|nr:MAG: hypothetical protein AUJ75_01665 [Candidatus Omnitrophica bacterium CG1_02_49_10]
MTEPKTIPKTPWYHSRVAVILALFTLGPLALPILIKSPKFHPVSKAILGTGVVLLTIYLIVLTIKLGHMMVKEAESLYMY